MSVTEQQAEWLRREVGRGGVQAFKAGIGSDGYPPDEDAWAILADGRSVWVAPNGETRDV